MIGPAEPLSWGQRPIGKLAEGARRLPVPSQKPRAKETLRGDPTRGDAKKMRL